MIDLDDLKKRAESAVGFVDVDLAPDVVLELIDEIKTLRKYLCTCRDCGGEGEIHTGGWNYYGHMDPPEPVMEKCGECNGTGLLGEIQDLYQVITDRDKLKAESDALRDEVAIDNKIIAERDRLLNMFECPEHGQCVPHAMGQVAALKSAERTLIQLGYTNSGGEFWKPPIGKAPVFAENQNKGHGHVYPRADGVRMRCGGPGMCKECSAELLHKAASRG